MFWQFMYMKQFVLIYIYYRKIHPLLKKVKKSKNLGEIGENQSAVSQKNRWNLDFVSPKIRWK